MFWFKAGLLCCWLHSRTAAVEVLTEEQLAGIVKYLDDNLFNESNEPEDYPEEEFTACQFGLGLHSWEPKLKGSIGEGSNHSNFHIRVRSKFSSFC